MEFKGWKTGDTPEQALAVITSIVRDAIGIAIVPSLVVDEWDVNIVRDYKLMVIEDCLRAAHEVADACMAEKEVMPAGLSVDKVPVRRRYPPGTPLPGPWRMDEDGSTNLIVTMDGEPVARVIGMNVENFDATGGRIAVAPELYDELANMVEAFLAVGGREDAAGVRAARAALAKADSGCGPNPRMCSHTWICENHSSSHSYLVRYVCSNCKTVKVIGGLDIGGAGMASG